MTNVLIDASCTWDLAASSCLVNIQTGRHPLALINITSSTRGDDDALKHFKWPHVTSMALKHRRDAFLMCHSAFIFFVFLLVPLTCLQTLSPLFSLSLPLCLFALFRHFLPFKHAHIQKYRQQKERNTHTLLNWSFCGYAVLIRKTYDSYCILMHTHLYV